MYNKRIQIIFIRTIVEVVREGHLRNQQDPNIFRLKGTKVKVFTLRKESLGTLLEKSCLENYSLRFSTQGSAIHALRGFVNAIQGDSGTAQPRDRA